MWTRAGVAVVGLAAVGGCDAPSPIGDAAPDARECAPTVFADPTVLTGLAGNGVFAGRQLGLVYDRHDGDGYREGYDVRIDTFGASPGLRIETPLEWWEHLELARLGSDSWALAWSQRREDEDPSIQIAELTSGVNLSRPRPWLVSGPTGPTLFSVVKSATGLAALVNRDFHSDYHELWVVTSPDAATPAQVRTTLPGKRGYLVAAGSELAAVWNDADEWGGENWLSLMSSEGEPLGGAIPLPPSPPASLAQVCWDGRGFAIVYTRESQPGWRGEIVFARIVDGQIGPRRRLSRGDGLSWNPSLACRDDGYGVVWFHSEPGGPRLVDHEIELVTISPDGIPTEPVLVGGRRAEDGELYFEPKLGAWGAGYAAFWTEYRPGAGFQLWFSANDPCAATSR